MASRNESDDHNILGEYGNLLAPYRGTGGITTSNGQSWKCAFQVGQMTSGDVIVLCDFLPPLPFFVNIEAEKFSGLTEGNVLLESVGRIMEINYLPDLQPTEESKVYAAFRLQQLDVRSGAHNSSTQVVKFGLTNFMFVGIEQSPHSQGICVLPLTVHNGSREHHLFVQPVHGYSKIVKRLKTVKGIDVTSELICNLKEFDGVEQAKDAADNLCYLFSVARGTKIQWVYCDQYDEGRKRVMRTHASRVTKPYCGLAAIDPRADGRFETKAFIEQTYRPYVSKREPWRLNHGTIDAYLDAKAEGDYLEFRAAKLVVALEMLKSVFLEIPSSPANEFVLDKNYFERLAHPISEAVNSILEQKGIKEDDRQGICSVRKIEGLNRRSFRRVIDKLCKHITLNVEEEKVRLFVACRDKLVHMGRFYCEAATEQERKDCPPLWSKTDEYYFLVNFLDRIFLRLLEYSGTYIDWRVPGNPCRSERV
jgi:hypothetical protein